MESTSEKHFENTENTEKTEIIEKGITDIKNHDTLKTGITDLITAIFTFFSVYFTVAQFYENTVGYTISIVYFLFFVFVAGTVIVREKRIRKEAVFSTVMLLSVIVSFSLFSGYDILRMLLTCYLFGYSICALKGIPSFPCNNTEDIYFQLKALFFVPIKKVFLPITVFISETKSLIKTKNRKITKAAGILIGVILAIPVFIAVVKLLENADFAFHYIFASLSSKLSRLTDKLTEQIPLNFDNLIPSLILSPFVFSFIFNAKHGTTKAAVEKSKRKQSVKKLAVISTSIIIGFYSLISIVYIIFIIAQFPFLFAAFSGDLPFGYSVSSYARQGFFEMSAVAAINFGLILAGETFVRKTDKNESPKIWKCISLFFCIFTLLLIIIAGIKMMLYINAYGLTEKRIAVVLADAVLFITFILIALKPYRKNLPHYRIIFISGVTAVCFILIFPIATFAASFNTQMYLAGNHNKIDIEYVRYSECKSIAAKNLTLLTESQSTVTAKNAKKWLYLMSEYSMNNEVKASTVDEDAFLKFIEKNKEKLLSYENLTYKYDYYSGSYTDFYLKTDRNYTTAYIHLYLDMPETIKEIKIENSLFYQRITKSDGSLFTYDEKIHISDWITDNNNGEFAVITLYLEDGKTVDFELRRDNEFSSESTENCIYVEASDYFYGILHTDKKGNILLTNKND